MAKEERLFAEIIEMKWLMWAIIILILGIVFFIYSFYIEPNRMEINNITIRGGVIFLTEEDYLRFLECIEKAVEKFKLEIFAFVLI